jgi:hypothetical protein
MQEASNLGAELAFVTRTSRTGALADIRHLSRGDLSGLSRVGAMMAGIASRALGICPEVASRVPATG